MITNPAFEFLRKHKKVDPETETLVLKKVRGRIATDDLLTVFENGISGQYGKIYSCDPATLLGWVDSWQGKKNSSKNYLESGLVDPNTKTTHPNYPSGLEGWHKEVNKCYTAFLNGVKEDNFHPDCYDRLMLDGRVDKGSCGTFDTDEAFKKGRQSALRNYFLTCKSKGWTSIYLIQ